MKTEELEARIRARIPPELAAGPPEVTIYPDEVVIILSPVADLPPGSDEERRSAAQALIARQRDLTRPLRMQIAAEIEAALRLPVAWGMRVGDTETLFTTRSVPVMTRLGRAERDVLDTLVAAGVAETRSSALAYTVRAFAAEHADWLAEVRQAIDQVRQVRSRLKFSRRGRAPTAPPTSESGVEREGQAD